MAVYSLPDLDFDYGALAPHIAGEIMELHHSKHHAAYVAGANTALDQLAEARDNDAFGPVAGIERALAFNLGGHTNHSIFWTNLSPDGGDKPVGDLASAIDSDFGSFDKFAAHFTNNAMTVFGSGWSILVWDTIAKKLLIVQLYDQQGNVPDWTCAAPHARHVGARVLLAVQERQGGLHQGLVERRQLGERAGPFRGRSVRERHQPVARTQKGPLAIARGPLSLRRVGLGLRSRSTTVSELPLAAHLEAARMQAPCRRPILDRGLSPRSQGPRVRDERPSSAEPTPRPRADSNGETTLAHRPRRTRTRSRARTFATTRPPPRASAMAISRRRRAHPAAM